MHIPGRLLALARLALFGRDRGGSVVVLFAAGLVPLALAVGAAVDFSAANRMQAVLTSSLDAATLSVGVARAAGRSTASTDADLSALVQQALATNIGSGVTVISSSASATIDGSGALASRASVTFSTKFLGMAGIRTWTVNAQSKVSAPGGPIEVAMALDTTGSMAGAKLTGLQQAANALATTLFSTTNAASNVKVGVVPFTYYVNVGMANRSATWITGAQDYSVPRSACWDTYPNATYSNPVTVNATCYADGAPYDCSYTSYQTVNLGAPVQQCGSWTDNYTWYGCVGSRNHPADLQDQANSANPVPALLNYGCATPLLRLTNSLSAVQTAINGLTAGGETYIAPGLLWGWRVLSPNSPFADGAAYGSRTRKYLVVMTDGFNTHSPNYPDHEGGDVTAANSLTTQTCSAIKQAGITIYTVAFQVSDLAIKSILQSCASSASGYYDSASIADMQAAFASIGNSITSIRILQ